MIFIAGRRCPITDIRSELVEISHLVDKHLQEFEELAANYRPSEELLLVETSLSEIIVRQLESVDFDLKEKNIKVIGNFQEVDYMIECDEGLIGNAILQYY